MSGNNCDIVSYDVFEIDLYSLKEQLLQKNIDAVIVYGIGNNGYALHRLIKKMGITVKYYVDVKAIEFKLKFDKHKVVSPEELKSRYSGEYIIVTPSIHTSIVKWMKSWGVCADKIICGFYRTESININYGSSVMKVSDDIDFCQSKPMDIKATFVTIAYNTPEMYFRRAIESVLRQSISDFIYTIIVNGATDDTLAIAEEYASKDARINLVTLKENLRWTDPRLLSAIKENIFGDFCCQLDSDDYYDERFLEISLDLAYQNTADVVCVRTCLFSADREYDPLHEGLVYDTHDKFFFNVAHPPCHIIGHQNIMKAYAKSEICSTFWGKLYSNILMERYLKYLLSLNEMERELYFRLDIAMTCKILEMADRVFYSDKVLHYSQYSKKNSTFTLAPIEWLMSLFFAYKSIKDEMYLYYGKNEARKYSKAFLKIHLMWMVMRSGMLEDINKSPYRKQVIACLNELYTDSIFTKILLNEKSHMRNACCAFYDKVGELVLKEE